MAKNFLSYIILMIVFSVGMCSCYDDSDNEEALANQINKKLQTMVKESLNGEYVLYTKVTVNSVDKTLLDGGCPTRVVFSWVGDSLSVAIPEMKIGNMPFAISFKSICDIRLLNSWEADEHVGGNHEWFKFEGLNGYVSTGGDLKQNGSSIKGYFQPAGNVIEFVIDYNVMNVRTICERQTLDIQRTRDYDTELAKYMAELTAYKKEHGLDINVPSYDFNDPSNGDFKGDDDLGGDVPLVSLEAVKGMLTDNIVLNSNVTVGGTTMAINVPTIVYFSWSDDVLTVKMSGLSIGNMPFKLSFNCQCPPTSLTEEDRTIYSSSWYKFEGSNGTVSSDPAMISGNDGVVICYFNPTNMQIALTIDFNVAGASAAFPRQEIDYSRIDNYDQEVEDFQKNKNNKMLE